jgi:hypothetical protein
MSKWKLKESIRQLLHLESLLPKSLADEVHIGNASLLRMHDQFVDIASELRIWTFYETLDSQLSGSGSGLTSEVKFGAPLVSIKSALLGVRQEDVFSLDSDHAHLASFGPNNIRTMSVFLADLTAAVVKAENLSDMYTHTPLKLKEHVKVELVGFYEDPDADMDSTIRLYTTRHHLGEFLVKGPERCLEERLSKVPRRQGVPRRQSFGNLSLLENLAPKHVSGGHSIWQNTQDTASPMMQGPIRPTSPGIVITGSPPGRPIHELEGANLSPVAMKRPLPSPSQAVLPIPRSRLSVSEGIHGGVNTMFEPSLLRPVAVDTSPSSQSKDGDTLTDERAELLGTDAALHDITAGFSRPDPSLRKFMWIHLPFTNPVWVKVRKEVQLSMLGDSNQASRTYLTNLVRLTARISRGSSAMKTGDQSTSKVILSRSHLM